MMMSMNRIDTERAYALIHERITRLEMAPGATIDPGALAEELGMGRVPVLEALKLLAHDGLVDIPAEGIFVSQVNLSDLKQLSELRVMLEGYSARLAAERATEVDLTVMEALRQEQADSTGEAPDRLFDIDHKFHQAVARAAHNRHLARVLDRFFGLSQRLWYLAMPDLSYLPEAVGQHLKLLDAIREGEADQAEQLMQNHVRNFYDQVRQKLEAEERVDG
jgi:DNA-binding GntR family transcriptional regulator